MDAGRVARLCRTPMMKHFNQLVAKQFDPLLFDPIGIRSSIRLAPQSGCCSIEALSPGVFAPLDPRLSADNLSGCRFPSRAPGGPAVHNLWNWPHEILRAARKFELFASRIRADDTTRVNAHPRVSAKSAVRLFWIVIVSGANSAKVGPCPAAFFYLR